MAKLEQMKQTLAERTARVETLEARLASAGGDPNDVARLKRRLAETRDELMAMRLAMKQQQKQVGSLKDRLAERNRRIVRLEEVADRFRKQRGAVEGVERQQKRTWKAMAGLYVEALAPGREGVAAAAYAAGQADLGGRLGDVQRSGDVDEDTRKLLAKLEVIAVRLELLDPTDPDRLASLRAAVRKHRLLERIDDALRRGELSGRLVRLLTETKLFLVGLNREA
jgi:chromosome segregation ATPase